MQTDQINRTITTKKKKKKNFTERRDKNYEFFASPITLFKLTFFKQIYQTFVDYRCPTLIMNKFQVYFHIFMSDCAKVRIK